MPKYTTFIFAYKDNKISNNPDYVSIHRKAIIQIDAIDEIRAFTLLDLYVQDFGKWELITNTK